MPHVQEQKRPVEDVARIFNEMAEEYDHLRDLWYRYTFGSIDRVLSSELRPSGNTNSRPIALDLGCGTGIQSLRLASMGYKVLGVDIAEELLRVARVKLSEAGYSDTEFYYADARAIPLEDSIADCVTVAVPL